MKVISLPLLDHIVLMFVQFLLHIIKSFHSFPHFLVVIDELDVLSLLSRFHMILAVVLSHLRVIG